MSDQATTDLNGDADSDTELDTAGDADISTANTMTERTNESRIKLYVMLDANRLAVTGALAGLVFVSLLVLGAVFYPAFQSDLQSGDTIETIFSTMLGAIITGTTLVVTITQLVVSQENGPLGDQHLRMSNTMDFRTYTKEFLGHPVPADPSAFLQHLVHATQRRTKAFRDQISGHDNDQLRDEVDEFTDSLTGNADEVKSELDGAKFGEFDVLYSALDFNYGWKIFQVERIQHEYEDVLTDDDQGLLEELKTTLTMFGPAREHIKTLYFEWALIDLSQMILYAAIPALIVSGGMLTFIGSGTVPGTMLGIPTIVWLVVGALSITLLPFLLLVSYIARIATIAKRTLAIGPLILRESQR
ncbi:hypothetical protein ACFQH3_12405 [Haladaptatus sp. GCM10025707]|uniref:hypothetical protein n=1 Tax=unclassified Haladaptatus TaxID=2622732 RepID=UPI0023E7A154|nr:MULTISPECIES: hypothetical protein [unclassified Haladaptatus]